MRHLETAEEGTITYRILRAIGRCRAADPELPLDEAVLSRRLEYILGETFRLLDRRLTLETGAGTDAGPPMPVQVPFSPSSNHLDVEPFPLITGPGFPV